MPHGVEQQRAKADIRAQGAAALAVDASRISGRGIVLAGRPYHVDPEINHGIPELIASYGLAVLTEDSSAHRLHACSGRCASYDQWVYHSRLYTAAEFVRDPAETSSWSSSTPSAAGSTPSRPTRSQEILEGAATVSTPF